ncbi:Hsp20/alpha crystallin family protein [Halocatena marina]|uniref:Hsp20/alpha crystallin family protein n=1 Tax=Halocatena marina TaxID=2934937 RepID=A0ABD5YKW8_9EURY|nr:Hsp20/alpha crystallin family protein [Halocatena marina]
MSALRNALQDLSDSVFVDVLESDDAYLFVVDLPGATPETVDAWVEGRRLRLEAKREKELSPAFRFLRENRSLFIDAQLPLPPDATDTDAEANMERGVLELHLPKTTAASGEQIPVTEG